MGLHKGPREPQNETTKFFIPRIIQWLTLSLTALTRDTHTWHLTPIVLKPLKLKYIMFFDTIVILLVCFMFDVYALQEIGN